MFIAGKAGYTMSMPLAQIVPEVQSLSRIEKLKLIQLLAEGLAGDEQAGIQAGRSYPVWSPEHAFGAADVMLRALANEKGET